MKDEMAKAASPSDEVLVRYLLGGLSDEESERLDERSVTDAEFADRLRSVEHDLADAYVRRELSAADREEWERRYLVSERGRQDLDLAQALLARERRAPAVRYGTSFTWGLAAAAALLVTTVVAYFAVVHRSSPVPVSASIAPAAGQASTPSAAPLRIAALTLTPMTRSLAEEPSLQLSAATEQVQLTLILEPNDFQRYDVAVRDLSTNGIVWRAAGVPAATPMGATRALVISMPASALQSRRYLITVNGARSRSADIIGTYPLRIVLQ